MKLAPMLVVALAGCGAAPRFYVKLPEKHTRLENGIKVVLAPDPHASLVYVDVRYLVGANEDPPGKGGLAHLVEHLRYDMRPAAGAPTASAALRDVAVSVNARTRHDSTDYYAVAAADRLGEVLDIEAARLAPGCGGLDEAALGRAREVVRAELRMRFGASGGALLAKVNAAVYPAGHPYRRGIGGSESEIDAITLADVCGAIERFYVPERAIVVVAGRVDEAAADRALGQLAAVPPRPAAPRVLVPRVPNLVRKVITITADIDQRAVVFARALPPQHSERSAALDLFLHFLPGWDEELPLVIGGPHAPVLLEIFDLDEGEDPEELVKKSEVGDIVDQIAGEESAMEVLRSHRLASLAMKLEPLAARAHLAADLAHLDPDGNSFAGELRRVERVSGAAFKDAVRGTFDLGKILLIVVEPSGKPAVEDRPRRVTIEAGEAEDLPVDFREAAKPLALPAGAAGPAASRRFTLENGVRVALLPSRQLMPVMTATVVLGTGAVHEENPGAALAAALTLDTPMATRKVSGGGGYFTWTGYVRDDAFGRLGFSVDRDADSDLSMFRVRGLGVYQAVLLEGLAAMVSRPRFDSDAKRRLVEVLEELRKTELGLHERAEVRLAEALYGTGHPYARVPSADLARDLPLVEPEHFAQEHYVAANATVVVTGDFDAAAAEKTIRKHFGAWPSGKADPPVSKPAAPRAAPAYVGVDGGDGSQVTIAVAFAAAAGGKDDAARHILSEILDRRVAAVRERLAASYSVNARWKPRVGPGSWEIRGIVDGDRAGQALAALRASIDGLRRGEGFLEDFVRARRRVLQRLLAEERVAALRGGVAAEDTELLAAKVARLTPHEVIRLVNAELRPEGEVIVAVGPRKRLEAMFAAAALKNIQYPE